MWSDVGTYVIKKVMIYENILLNNTKVLDSRYVVPSEKKLLKKPFFSSKFLEMSCFRARFLLDNSEKIKINYMPFSSPNFRKETV